MTEFFIASAAAIILCVISAGAGFALGRSSVFKRKTIRASKQTETELERIRQSREEYRNIARYDGTVQE